MLILSKMLFVAQWTRQGY